MLRFAVIVGVLAAIMLVASLTRERIDIMNFYANPMLFEFVTGIILGIICELGIVRRSAFWLLAITAGFMLLWAAVHFNGGFGVTLIAATMIVGGAVFLPPIRHNPISSLGDASYSLYLSHAICLSAIGVAWGHLFPEAPWQLFVLSAVAIAFAIAFLLYRYFEVPVTAELKRRMSQNVRVRSVAAPSATEPLR